MAEIVQTLFGVSPESYQQQQSALADQRALEYAKLKPFERANYAIGRGAYGLAGAIGGALGGQDPELQRVTMRQQIAGQIDFNDDDSIKQGIVALNNAGDTQGAMQLQQIYLNQAKTRAETSKALRERQGADPFEQLVRTGKYTPQSLAAYKASGKVDDLEIIEKTKKPTTNELTNAENIALLDGPVGSPAYNAKFMAEYNRLTAPKESKETKTEIQKLQEYAATLTPGSSALAQVQARIKSLGESGGTKVEVKNVMPGDKALVDIPAFRAKVQDTIGPQLKTINATDQALQAIEDSLATGNFASYRAAQVQFARAISGAGDLSQRELKAAGADPSLLGGTADYLSSLFTSTPTTDTQNKIKTTLEAIRKVAAKKSSVEVEQQRKIALRSPGYNPDAVTEALTFPELAPRGIAPIYATNGKERIMSTDNGKTWSPVR